MGPEGAGSDIDVRRSAPPGTGCLLSDTGLTPKRAQSSLEHGVCVNPTPCSAGFRRLIGVSSASSAARGAGHRARVLPLDWSEGTVP